MSSKISYTYQEAHEATGHSVDTIKRAVNSGDLPTHKPKIDGRVVNKPVILKSDLERWVANR